MTVRTTPGDVGRDVNVTQKDQTLNEIIDFCEEVKSVWCRLEGAHARGFREALAAVIAHCRDNLECSGVMPLEVPNQSKQAKEPHLMATISHSDGWGNPLCPSRYECSCGYWTYDEDEAEAHLKENP